MDGCFKRTNRFFSLWLHFSACLLVTETKEDICVCPICICTVFVKQIGSDSRWFTQQPKASIVILKPHFSPLYLSPLFHPVDSHMHPSSPLHWFCRSSALPVLLSLVYLRDTQFVLFKVVFLITLVSLAVSGPPSHMIWVSLSYHAHWQWKRKECGSISMSLDYVTVNTQSYLLDKPVCHTSKLALSFDWLHMISFREQPSEWPFVLSSSQTSFTQDANLFFFFFLSWHCMGDIVSHFLSLCVSSSSRFASLHLSFLPLPTLVCPLGISSEHSPPFFFFFPSGLWTRGRGGEIDE